MEDKINRGKLWTARYAVINATYFMGICGIHAYASVFMLERGFTNSQIGTLLAFANVFSVLIQPVIAGFIDRPGKLTNRRAASVCTVLMIVLSLSLAVIKQEKILIFVIFMLIYMIQMAYQPIIIAMNFEYAKRGCRINFGLARGLGSVGFAAYSPVLGNLLERYDVSVIHIGDAVVLTVGLLFLLTFTLPKEAEMKISAEDRKERIKASAGSRKEEITVSAGSGKEEPETSADGGKAVGNGLTAHNNFFDFAKHYPRFMLFLAATVLVFFGHNMINDYLIQIITPLGGTEKHLGYATSLAAVLELPTMALFAKMTKKISCERLLQLSTVFFTLKLLLLFGANGMTGVFISQFCQLGAYALFIPASAYYANMVMEQLDQVKGQAYVNCAVTISGMFSGLICGRVLDAAGPKMMLLCGVIASFAGMVLTAGAVRRRTER